VFCYTTAAKGEGFATLMRSKYQIVPFTVDYLKSAVDLFIDDYSREQEAGPLLPSKTIEDAGRIYDSVKSLLANPGVAVLQDTRVVAFMLTGYRFAFKGQQAILVPEYCHASVPNDRSELYQIMYMRLADEWAGNHIHLHIIGHFAHDTVLQESLCQLGFGAIIAEALRDLCGIQGSRVTDIVEETKVERLLDISIEDMRYYRNAPIFLVKELEPGERLLDLESSIRQGDTYFVLRENDETGAYFCVGESASGPGKEGFLLRDTRTAQVKNAFAKPHLRGKGIGKSLLQRAVDWSAEHGYERLFVEFETANYFGGNFWRTYFSPYLYYSMRYIDSNI
jgi:GNAT superfamily N-acetyltransferase